MNYRYVTDQVKTDEVTVRFSLKQHGNAIHLMAYSSRGTEQVVLSISEDGSLLLFQLNPTVAKKDLGFQLSEKGSYIKVS